ncbi:MAG: hypothetical protein FD127_3395 [Acidimicrobiaceae bacterium]|nr:MAG: hypothetical protein FD127_3395 [Acidimicrobiaceae bacterium]
MERRDARGGNEADPVGAKWSAAPLPGSIRDRRSVVDQLDERPSSAQAAASGVVEVALIAASGDQTE